MRSTMLYFLIQCQTPECVWCWFVPITFTAAGDARTTAMVEAANDGSGTFESFVEPAGELNDASWLG